MNPLKQENKLINIPLETEVFSYQHILDSENNKSAIQNFLISQNSGKGLENYLKYTSIPDEEDNSARTYLVNDKKNGEIAAYFTLKSGLFTVKAAENYFYTIPSIELADFAVNADYRKHNPQIENLGTTVFNEFVLPLSKSIQTLLGVQALYIFALPEDKLIRHYKTMGFNRLEQAEENFVHSHVKPKYDDTCIFMYQIL